MPKVKSKLAELITCIIDVLKLAYKIDGKLVTMYFLTAAIGAVTPLITVYLLKIAIDQIVTTSAIKTPETTIPLVIIFAFTGYFIMKLTETVFYRGLNISYYDYLLRNKFQAGLSHIYAKKVSGLDIGHHENPENQGKYATMFQTQAKGYK